MSEITFAEFLTGEMRARGWSNRVLAQKAGVSFRAISEACSGKLEVLMQDPHCSWRKRIGASAATHRIIAVLGAEAMPWAKRLGLEDYHGHETSLRVSQEVIRNGLEAVLSSEDIEWLHATKAVLGEMLTLDLALRLLVKRHKVD